MKQCQFCGNTLADNATFCNRCGRSLVQSYQQGYPQQNQQYRQYPTQNQYQTQNQYVQQPMQGQQMQQYQQMPMNQQYVPSDYVPQSAKTAKTLGVLSLLFFAVLAIPAIIYANKSKAETGGVLCKEAKDGKTMGILAIILWAIAIVTYSM